jgi:hypothetical protein
MTQPAHNSSWKTSPFFLYWGVVIAVIGAFGCGIEAANLARILRAGNAALADPRWLTSFMTLMFVTLAACGVIAVHRFVRRIRTGL